VRAALLFSVGVMAMTCAVVAGTWPAPGDPDPMGLGIGGLLAFVAGAMYMAD
jgi:hypothetical protein